MRENTVRAKWRAGEVTLGGPGTKVTIDPWAELGAGG